MRYLLAFCIVVAVAFVLPPPISSQQSKLNKRQHSTLGKQGLSSDPEQEPNETSAQADPLSLPGGRVGNAKVGDVTGIVINYTDGVSDAIEDLFAVTITQSTRLDLTLMYTTATADLDLFLLKETSGQPETVALSNGTSTTEHIITTEPLVPGRYLVGVSAYSGGSDYTLTAAIVDAVANPAPMLIGLSPTMSRVGSVGFNLRVNGANFVPGSIVRWNGTPRSTTYLSETLLIAAINTSDLTMIETAFVTVVNPAPGGGTSNALPFIIRIDVPGPDGEQEPNEASAQANTIALPGRRNGVAVVGDAAVIPVPYTDGTQDKVEDLFAVTLSGSARLDITLTFTNRDADLDLFLLSEANGQFAVLGLSNGDATTERIMTADVLPPGRYLVGVSAFSGGSSYTLTVAVPVINTNPMAMLASLTPASAPAGGANFTLALDGANFLPNSQVLWNGAPRPTNLVSANQLTASISASDLAAAGTVFITVSNPAPGGGLSNALPFVITGPPDPDTEQEPNDHSAQANPLTVPGRRTGIATAVDAAGITIAYADGRQDKVEDLFAITLGQSAQLSLTLNFTNAVADLDLYLLEEKDGRVSVLAVSNGSAQSERIITPGAITAGRYLVGVSAFVGASSYTLTAAINSNRFVTVSSANFSGVELAGESIVAGFGVNLAISTEVAMTIPLPTELVGTTVKVIDSPAAERLARLFFVSPTQINYQIPPGTASGPATVVVMSGDESISVGMIQIVSVAPEIFTAEATGKGLAVGESWRVKANGMQITTPLTRFDAALGKIVAMPIELGEETDQVFVILYGTGIRLRSSLQAVPAKIGGVTSQVFFAGAQGGYIGLDQINLGLPRSLAGRGEVDVELSADGKAANKVRVSIK